LQQLRGRIESAAVFLCLQQECWVCLSPLRHPHTPAETCPAITNMNKMAVSRFSISQLEICSLLRRLSISFAKAGDALGRWPADRWGTDRVMAG
jgi:hypothetical protein